MGNKTITHFDGWAVLEYYVTGKIRSALIGVRATTMKIRENEKHMFCSYILTIIESLRATIKKMYTLSQERQQKICDKSSKSFMSSCLFCFKIILDILIGIVLMTKES